MHGRVVVEAPAKVNLSLDITGTDGRGYHLVETVMHSVNLSDLLLISRVNGERIRVTSTDPSAPEDETNLAWKATTVFFQETGLHGGLSIHIDKRIPAQAGLGGGSADAAAVLVGLNHLFETGLNTQQLCTLGVMCGADVPFCIVGGCCLATGIGEKLTPLKPLTNSFLCIAKPGEGISTVEAFHRYDELAGQVLRPDTQAMLRALERQDPAAVGSCMVNVFDSVCKLDLTGRISDIMLRQGAAGAALTGSGSAVCGLFSSQSAALYCVRKLESQACHAYLSAPAAYGARILTVD